MERSLRLEGKSGVSPIVIFLARGHAIRIFYLGDITANVEFSINRPGTALTFALTIVELISGKEKRDEVAGPMILSEALMDTLHSHDK